MNRAFLLTGGNIGQPLTTLKNAMHAIEDQCGPILKHSSIYQTAAWGNEEQPDFLNQVIVIETKMAPAELLKTLLDIEQDLGRTRNKKYDPRIIDIDILFYNDLILTTENLEIPHPRLHLRKFVLVPLNEVESEFVHPVFNKKVSQLLVECQDVLNVKKFSTK